MTQLPRFFLGSGLLLLLACASPPRPAAAFRAISASPAHGLSLEIAPEHDGISAVRLAGGALMSGIVSGEAWQEGGGWRIKVQRLYWFSNWPNGWTEASFLLEGSLSLGPGPTGWGLSAESPPRLDLVDSASIRYFGSYLRDDRGLAEFTHRWERIRAVADFLLSKPPFPGSLGDPPALRSFLFPELYGQAANLSGKLSPPDAQGYRWNLEYTKEHFPEALGILRDSGTMLRDYKESPGLWSLALGWSSLWGAEGQPLLVERK